MKILVYGLGRRRYHHDVVENDLEKNCSITSTKSYKSSQVTLEKHQNGGLSIVCCSEKIVLNGHYVVNVHLTKREIANLFREAYGDADLKTVVSMLSE